MQEDDEGHLSTISSGGRKTVIVQVCFFPSWKTIWKVSIWNEELKCFVQFIFILNLMILSYVVIGQMFMSVVAV